jgi:hypothetical protein
MFSIKLMLTQKPSGQIDESNSGLTMHEEIRQKITAS